MNKHAVIISCFNYYDCRMKYWEHSLKEFGYETTYITSDFDHIAKKPFSCTLPNSMQLHVMPYRKNLSIQRILSHRMFAKQTYRFLVDRQPDIVIACIPPNFLASYLGKYKRKYPQTKLIYDIYDLWPETFPSSTLKKILSPIFRIWSNLRDRHLPLADFVSSECQLFLDRLHWHTEHSGVIHFALPSYHAESIAQELPTDQAHIAYLGSINNIVDIPCITAILRDINRYMPTTLHIIGDGESRQKLCQSVSEAGVRVHFHGMIFDEAEKHRILSQCHFGLNIMKESVCVGLTMKSVDYLRHHLPLISNIPADTQCMLQQYNAGFHLTSSAEIAEQVAQSIRQDIAPMKANAAALFAEQLSDTVCQSIYTKIIRQVLHITP